ncbi:hypothetical protein [Dictyobacter halimunensis]|uniref:hypothetical protein n=1 Tax=Dictyobacter halimunensis TaxID=3026934 RepID=UPI0030C681F0
MQRRVYWWQIWQRKLGIWSRVSAARAYLFSLLLWMLSGYGYRFGRSLLTYALVLVGFAAWYWWLSQGLPHPLGRVDALILSVSDMVGRGFFRQDYSLSDPYAGWSVLEGLCGLFMDVLLISTLTQRLFKK